LAEVILSLPPEERSKLAEMLAALGDNG